MAAVLALPSELQALAPEFASETTPRCQIMLNMAANQLSPDLWDSNFHDGQLLLAAHILTIMNRDGSGGMLTSDKAGDLQQQFENIFKNPTYWDLTSYGMLFRQLMDTFLIPITVTQPKVPPRTSDDLGIYGGNWRLGGVFPL